MVIFTAGAACGVLGLLAWQETHREKPVAGSSADPSLGEAAGSVVAGRGTEPAADAPGPATGSARESRVGSTASGVAASDRSDETSADASEPGVADVLMQMGAAAAEGKVRSRVASLSEALGLTEPQEQEVAAILEETQRKQQEAVRAFLERRATIQMLPLMDGHDPDGEAAIVALLDAPQREAYAAYQAEQESERIEMKANKELMDLQQMLDLSPEQKDLVFDLFTELARNEKPGSIDDSVTVEQFTGFLDESLGVRREAMGEILTPAQATIYGDQLTNFRNLVIGSLGGQQ